MEKALLEAQQSTMAAASVAGQEMMLKDPLDDDLMSMDDSLEAHRSVAAAAGNTGAKPCAAAHSTLLTTNAVKIPLSRRERPYGYNSVPWNANFMKLKALKAQNGNCFVANRENAALYRWVTIKGRNVLMMAI
mmetsp:Transcript_21341/g.35289  ORF Transcript_21341/g.35289 Transcript_21341/m.35289 type:complete len:133 (-) Transcript_21341:142-540(-)